MVGGLRSRREPFGARFLPCPLASVLAWMAPWNHLKAVGDSFANGRWTVSPADYEIAEVPDADCREGYRSARINVRGWREAFGSEQI